MLFGNTIKENIKVDVKQLWRYLYYKELKGDLLSLNQDDGYFVLYFCNYAHI